MRILLLTPFLPHRDAGHGTATVASRFVEHFSGRHRLRVLTFCRTPREWDLLRELMGSPARVKALPFPGSGFWRRQWVRGSGALSSRPFMVSLFDVEPMRREVEELMRSETFDLVQIDTTQMGSYVDLLDGHGVKKVLLEIDVSMKPLRRRYEQERSSFRRFSLRREWRRMRRYEPALCRKFDRVYAVSEEDRKLLAEEGGGLEAGLFRYGVDSEIFDIPPKLRTDLRILFFGSTMHPPNVDAAKWFAGAILPRIRAQVPEARMIVLGGREGVEDLAREPGVTVGGWVPDVRSHLAEADVCVVPLRWGGGVKLKTLEMMAAGRPVVTTSVGCEGIRAEHGVHVLVADSAEEFARHTVALLRDEERGRALAENARLLMMREHRWSENLAELEEDYERLLYGADSTVSGARASLPRLDPCRAGIEPAKSIRRASR